MFAAPAAYGTAVPHTRPCCRPSTRNDHLHAPGILNPVAIEAYFIEQRGTAPAQVVNRQRLQRQDPLLCAK